MFACEFTLFYLLEGARATRIAKQFEYERALSPLSGVRQDHLV